MFKLKEKKDCCGCGACANACNHGAIKLEHDSLGFLYPNADANKCTNCGLCMKVCPMLRTFPTKQDTVNPPLVYAARHKSPEEINSSRSGGVFIALSDIILNQGGAIYGAALGPDMAVTHLRATTKNDRNRFKGSKYVQSDISNTFKQIVADLRKGLPVLYSGTGCQIEALRKFVPILLQNNLLLVDIICHGVPSPNLFKDYLAGCEKAHGKQIINFNFRDKSRNGWSSHEESMVFEDGMKIFSQEYTKMFYSNAFFRDSCYSCPFANTSRPGDITIGDFWGWEKVDKYFNADDKGCSLVMINSDKGKELFESVISKLDIIETDVAHCLQRNLIHPTPPPDNRSEIISCYKKLGYKWMHSLYFTNKIPSRIYRKIMQIARRLL